MIPDQTFSCPNCGAPGQISFGNTEYSCTCRFSQLSQSVVHSEPPLCPKCGQVYFSIPRMGISHICSTTDGEVKS